MPALVAVEGRVEVRPGVGHELDPPDRELRPRRVAIARARAIEVLADARRGQAGVGHEPVVDGVGEIDEARHGTWFPAAGYDPVPLEEVATVLPQDPIPTLQLLAAAQRGDRPAMDELFLRLEPRVVKVVALRMGCRERDLEDRKEIVQQSLLDAFRSLHGFEPRGEGALLHWLARLVQNNLIDQARRRNAQRRDEGRRLQRPDRSTVLTDSILGTDNATPSKFAQARETEERVEAALLALDERQRRVIELRKLCDMSFEDIAKELELGAESSARSLFSRAMAELAKRL